MARAGPKAKKRGSRAETALSELCTRLGYCIPPAAQDAILANPPLDTEAFVDAVLVAEGMDPNLVLEETRRPLRLIIDDWLYDSKGRGSTSDLPRFPSDA
jgi:hypothetical protein